MRKNTIMKKSSSANTMDHFKIFQYKPTTLDLFQMLEFTHMQHMIAVPVSKSILNFMSQHGNLRNQNLQQCLVLSVLRCIIEPSKKAIMQLHWAKKQYQPMYRLEFMVLVVKKVPLTFLVWQLRIMPWATVVDILYPMQSLFHNTY